MLISLFILFLLWLCFGSFSTVLVSRWQSGQTGIMTGRSECPTCRHILWFSELFPVLSWLIQWGKCKNCKSSIPTFYPLSELFMGALFVWSWWIAYWFGYTWNDLMWWVFLFWTFVTGIYIIYDLRYMEISLIYHHIIHFILFLLIIYRALYCSIHSSFCRYLYLEPSFSWDKNPTELFLVFYWATLRSHLWYSSSSFAVHPLIRTYRRSKRYQAGLDDEISV
jgi:prepilin signal peptidase PulO-like enzyme (type II secretory pathway)